ncbi:MAG: hypothetical protein ABWX96_03490 [Propionibacteriaceae bacterium]
MSEPTPGTAARPELSHPGSAPETGVPAVDQAVASLAELDEAPLAEHHDRLASAHAALHDALSSDQS